MSDHETEMQVRENHQPADVMMPVVVNLGKKKKKTIKRLKRGKGPAMDEILDVVEQVQVNLGDQAEGKVILPVVVIYRQKTRRRLRPWF